MKIRMADERDYYELAVMKWEHGAQDDADYGENNLDEINKDEFIGGFIKFLGEQTEYKIFIAEDNAKAVSVMFVHLIKKLPKLNGNAKYIAYITNVYTKKAYRGKGIGTNLLNYIKKYLTQIKCELIFVWPSNNTVNWYKRNGFNEKNEIFECPLCEE